MWFGNDYGLNRFDGYLFKVFTHEPKDPNSLGGVSIFSLFKDRVGELWIGTGQAGSGPLHNSALDTSSGLRTRMRDTKKQN